MAGFLRMANAADVFAKAAGNELYYYRQLEGEEVRAYPIVMNAEGTRLWDTNESVAIDDVRIENATEIATYQIL